MTSSPSRSRSAGLSSGCSRRRQARVQDPGVSGQGMHLASGTLGTWLHKVHKVGKLGRLQAARTRFAATGGGRLRSAPLTDSLSPSNMKRTGASAEGSSPCPTAHALRHDGAERPVVLLRAPLPPSTPTAGCSPTGPCHRGPLTPPPAALAHSSSPRPLTCSQQTAWTAGRCE